MSVSGGPDIAETGLVLAIDAANRKGISPSANQAWNSAPQFIKNIISPTELVSAINGAKIGNLQYYTVFAIDYPESIYGGPAALRQGVTPGFNVTSGTKIYEASRALHLWVWNNITNSWVPDAFFTGERLNGHCYDSYVGTAEVDKWVADYNNIKNAFPDITVIVMGSHRDSYHTTAQYEILKDLGAPNNVDSIINFADPEWILVGVPGTGAGNGIWAFQNYSTDPTKVAHAVFPLPLYGNSGNYCEFDGIDDRGETATNISYGNNTTWTAWINRSASVNSYNMFMGRYLPYFGILSSNEIIFSNTVGGTQQTIYSTNFTAANNTWYYLAFTTEYVGTDTVARIYINGILNNSTTQSGGQGNIDFKFAIGDGYNATWYPFNGRIAAVNVYNRTLSSSEILQNFSAHRSRFGV
jgi:hypothetical protein